MAEWRTKVLIIGSGPAGFTAGIYAARAGFSPLIVTGLQLGGQLTTTPDIENYPGFIEPIAGTSLMENMQKQAERVGAKVLCDMISKVDFAKSPFICEGDNGSYVADAVIIATGASPRTLSIKGEDKFRGFGVSYCATCDGFFYRGKKVCVVGGGNVALEEALYLANIAEEVVLIHRRQEFRAEKILQEKVFANPKIKLCLDAVPEECLGTENPLSLTALKVKNVKDGSFTEIPCDGVFVAIGYNPNTEIFKGQIELYDTGFIKTAPNSTATSVEGVFAAGDVQSPLYRQAIIAASSGCLAALEAEKYIGR